MSTAAVARLVPPPASRLQDDRAIARLVDDNLGLADSMAQRFRGSGLGVEELVQAARVGLFEAARRFDPSRGLRFAPYACWWIRHLIQDELDSQSRTVRVPGRLRKRARELVRLAADFRNEIGAEPTVAELAFATGMSEAQVETTLRVDAQRAVELEEGAAVPAPATRGPAAELEAAEQREELLRRLSGLPVRERWVMAQRLEDRSFVEIGRSLGVTPQRAGQLAQRARQLLIAGDGHAAVETCPSGHPRTTANTYVHDGRRRCRACRSAWDRRARAAAGVPFGGNGSRPTSPV